jgi:hypothetical protein
MIEEEMTLRLTPAARGPRAEFPHLKTLLSSKREEGLSSNHSP